MLRILAFCAVLVASAMPLRAEVISVDGAGLQRLLAEGVPVVDVRRPEEWRRLGIVEGSHLLTFFDKQGRYDLDRWLPALTAIADADRPVAFICHSGRRSLRVARLLDEEFGYRHVYSVQGGISEWIGEGRPTVEHP